MDSGGLIAYERRDERAWAAIQSVRDRGRTVVIPAGVLAQAWRDGARQALLSALLKASDVRVESLSEPMAKAAGELCRLTGTADVIDASVVVTARRMGGTVLTSDPGDLARLDPGLRLIPV